jgi:phosphoglycolate phosphatase-like HAD superfamily hydrolase
MANSVDEKRKVEVVALDFDGVVTNLDIDWDAAIRQASRIVGEDVKSLLTFYERCFGTAMFQKVSLEMEKIELEASMKAQVLPFVKESLTQFYQKKVEVYVVSMQSFRVVKGFLDQHELAGFFKGVITRERCPSKKAQVECVLKETSCSPEQVLLVDDSKRNLNLCRELGVTCFYFQRNQGYQERERTWSKLLSLIDKENK